MPNYNKSTDSNMPGPHRSIRDELEKRAWVQNPDLANRLNNRLEGGKRHSDSSRRIMRWQDRILLMLGFVLLVLLVIRAETTIADDQLWGLH